MADLVASAKAILMAHEIYHYALQEIADGCDSPIAVANAALAEAEELDESVDGNEK